MHKGDNRAGTGDGDDEQIELNLNDINPKILKLAFPITCYGDAALWKSVNSVYLRLLNATTSSHTEIARFELSPPEGTFNAVLGCTLEKNADTGKWVLSAIGDALDEVREGVCCVRLFRELTPHCITA